jgi:hypothetical protein
MIAEIKNKVALRQLLADESFKSVNAPNYNLIVELDTTSVHLAVFDTVTAKYIAFEHFDLDAVFSSELLADILQMIENQSKLFFHKYKNVTCVLLNSPNTLVPEGLFDEARKKLYLKFNAQLEGNEFVLVDEVQGIQAKNVFALPMPLKIKLDGLFKNVNYRHFSSALIHDIVLDNKNNDLPRLYVNIASGHFEVVYMEGKKMQFYNTFNYHSTEDYIYYLLFVFEQLALNPEKVELILLGDITNPAKNSEIYTITYKYVKTVKLGSRNTGNKYCHQLQELPAHNYFTLFSSYNL